MNNRLRLFFEFRLPFVSYLILFFSILFLYFFGFEYATLGEYSSQVGLIILFIGFGIRVLASITIKYLGKIKITGIYALCRQPLLLGQFVSFIGLNIIVSNVYFCAISCLVFVCNDVLSAKKYDKILEHHYKDIWRIYAKNTNFVIPFTKRVNDVFKPSVSSMEIDNSKNTYIFIIIYAILVEIATLGNM